MKDGEIITRIQQGERELLNILICSAFSSSSFVALIVVLVIYTVPLFLTQLAYEPLQYALSFMPI